LAHILDNESYNQQRDMIAKVIKFVILGTDIAGHEHLQDSQIEDLANWITSMRKSAGKTAGQTK
jgi:hypothetical protein